MDYMLGQRPDWMTCEEAEAELRKMRSGWFVWFGQPRGRTLHRHLNWYKRQSPDRQSASRPLHLTLSPQWQIETDPDKTSEWEVRFIAETAHRTRVEIEHRNLERHGEGWESVRDGVAGDQGWPLYLQRFADLLAREA